MQEVETEEDPPLKQQEEETNTVPDDSSLLHWETAAVVVHCFSWTNAHIYCTIHLISSMNWFGAPDYMPINAMTHHNPYDHSIL